MTELVEHGQLFIGGELADPLGADVIEVVSPHAEEVIGRVPHASRGDVDRAVAVARRAFDEGPWPRMTLDERIGVVTRIKDAIGVRHEEIARVISSENGSPYSWSVLAQALGAMMVWDAAITVARTFTHEEWRDGVLGKILVRREPVGVAAAVVPWNVPQFVAAAKLAPALLTGCAVVLKPSPESPLDAYVLGEIAREAGLPEGVLSILPRAPHAFRLDSARQSHPVEPDADAGEQVLAAAESCPVEAIVITVAGSGEPVFPPEE